MRWETRKTNKNLRTGRNKQLLAENHELQRKLEHGTGAVIETEAT
jgi:hypothetical protein